MPTTLRALMSEPRFDLRPVSGASEAVLSRPLPWAHSSDLPDPTPWIGAGGLLLTDGVQFGGQEPEPALPYARRLVDHGILALGFATGIVHDDIPHDLIAAARQLDLPLIEVSERTPFMGIIRFVSDAVAEDDRLALERSLKAQRSVARAALRPDGLAEILRELERNLDCWVALYDARGSRVPVPTRHGIPGELVAEVDAAVEGVLSRGRTAAVRLSLRAGEATLQTLGQRGRLRGVLAVGVGASALDRAGVDLVDAVIALASIALEQSRTLDDARRRLRSGVLELLAAGRHAAATRTVEHLWGALPSDPLRVGCVALAAEPGAGAADVLRSSLELLAEERPGGFFFAEQDGLLVTVTAADDREALTSLLARQGARAGFSAASTWEGFADAMAEARRALARATDQRPVAEFDDLARAGLLGHLEHTRAHDIARRMLLPLDGPDAPADLRHALVVWLDHNGAWGPAAAALGLHRHTLRHRVDAAARLLGLDLESFAGRAELWGALQLTAAPARAVGSGL
ncbi:PucR family transcriptional regulator [Microbacterium enclense]|uniref:PucR family transcriptional regulator n=1 Tax=Microbacterium enclense TaxID=993073 RepID=UPI0036DE8C41